MKWTGSRATQLFLMTNASLLIALPLLYTLCYPFIHHKFKFFTTSGLKEVWQERPFDILLVLCFAIFVVVAGIISLITGVTTNKRHKEQLRPWDSQCYCKPGAKSFLIEKIRCNANITKTDSGKIQIAFNSPQSNCAKCGPDDGKPIYCGK